jgi:hypothetical protein
MNTYWHLLSWIGFFNRGWTRMNTDINNKLLKNCAANAAHGHGRVGHRVAPESTATALSDRNDGQHSFLASVALSLPVVSIVEPRRRGEGWLKI